MQEKILNLSAHKVSMVFKYTTLDGAPAVFIGQCDQDGPNGWCRVYTNKGNIYEGEVHDGAKQGWGRFITGDSIQTGQWTNGNLRNK